MYVRVNTYLTQVGYCSVPCFFQCLRVFVKAQRAVLQRHFPSLVPGGLWFLPPRLCHLPDLPRCSLPSDAPPPPLSVWPVALGYLFHVASEMAYWILPNLPKWTLDTRHFQKGPADSATEMSLRVGAASNSFCYLPHGTHWVLGQRLWN